MGLFGFGKKKPVPQKNTNSFGEDLDHLTKDGELPWGWIYANRKFTEPIEDLFRSLSDAYINSRHDGVRMRYNALKPLVVFMEDTRKMCLSKGECFAEWSTILVANPDILENYKTELQYIEDNMDELIQKEKMIAKLNNELKAIIKSEPGVIQSDLYKRFAPDMKNHISNELYQMEVHDVIIREKAGRSYKLYLK